MALRQCGTDFTTMELMFTGTRDRNQLKNKFKKVGCDRVQGQGFGGLGLGLGSQGQGFGGWGWG